MIEQGLLSWLFKGGLGFRVGYRGSCRYVDVDIDSNLGCLRGGSKSVQVLFNGTEAVIVLTSRFLI